MTTEQTTDVFNDTCVLFGYAVEGRSAAKELFEEHVTVEKVASRRVKREFQSVSGRHQDIHRELLEVVSRGELSEYEPEAVDGRANDVSYVVDLYSELASLDDRIEVVRRLNELVNRLEKADRELFGEDGAVEVLNVQGADGKLKGLLKTVVSNEADVRVLCDAVEWRTNGGSGNFLSEDVDDILGRQGPETENRETETNEGGASGGLSGSFSDFWGGGEEKSQRERINDQIEKRYGSEARLRILSTEEFLSQVRTTPELTEVED